MGLFSFLTGKKEEMAEAPASASAAPAVPQASQPPVTAAAAPAVSPSPSSSWGTPADGSHAGTPFTAPDAWNTEALTAPRPEATGETPQIGATDPARTAEFQQKIIDVIKTVYDPEIPVDIYELGLVYEILVDAECKALVKMTLTSPACPSAQQLPQEVRYKVKAIPGITEAWVEIVWEPPWTKDRMSEAAKLTLGFF